MAKETTAKIARLAALGAKDPYALSPKQIQSVCASALAQFEIEQESVKAWGCLRKQKLQPWADRTRQIIMDLLNTGAGYQGEAVPVLITRNRKRGAK